MVTNGVLKYEQSECFKLAMSNDFNGFLSLKWISSTFWWNRDRNAVLCLCLTFRAVTVFLTLPFWKGRDRKVGKPRIEKLNKDTKWLDSPFSVQSKLISDKFWFYNGFNIYLSYLTDSSPLFRELWFRVTEILNKVLQLLTSHENCHVRVRLYSSLKFNF